MTLIELAERLSNLADSIKASHNAMNNSKCITETDRFIKSLLRFERIVDAAGRGDSPSAIELRTVMQGLFTEGVRSAEELGDFSKKVLGKKTARSKDMTYEAYREKVIADIVNKGRADFAIALLKRLTETSQLNLRDLRTESLLLEIRKLGSLSEDQLEIERVALTKNPEMLHLMAKTAGVRFKPANKAETIFKKLTEIARRYYENTGA